MLLCIYITTCTGGETWIESDKRETLRKALVLACWQADEEEGCRIVSGYLSANSGRKQQAKLPGDWQDKSYCRAVHH